MKGEGRVASDFDRGTSFHFAENHFEGLICDTNVAPNVSDQNLRLLWPVITCKFLQITSGI